ncbi:TPT-domain-containing protein [Sodiomyces alkalinus F11]|uniref:TPT-domain-containing protein n=1 Tax=Sodiomyces alkalinus (strain CBS 110278 / VKM F-3762 / F11) TaxID=1314773 RepID=A0A3N2PY04_SODAK|nr:TPT-domain-containing protein [Sodiomyces alkalinus F11]ROT39348.1 TPT-domain-containing protein [Sodiomyces alkalinus F11]
MEKFPDLVDSEFTTSHGARGVSPIRVHGIVAPNGSDTPRDRWLPRRDSRTVRWDASGQPLQLQLQGPPGHGHARAHSRQKSLTEAFRTIRSRRGSVTQNAQEIAEALRAPVSPTLIILCLMWYTSSALTNTSSKSILTAWSKPATLTVIQFAFVSSYCLFSSWLASVFPALKTRVPALKYAIRPPTRDVILTTLPLAAFQIFGHLLSSSATSQIPVSLVHTIKGLSPLFTVLAYRFVYNIRYSTNTYLSLIPLTLGVMLACSGKHSSQYGGELLGVLSALLATIIFVTQNIFSKRLFNEAAKAEAAGMSARSRKLDKLNLLCYSSGMAFVLTLPIWFWSEGVGIVQRLLRASPAEPAAGFDHGRLALEFFFNGTCHFGQNILAFSLLSIVSPVTYSVASLIKRVFVIVIAIIWFRNPTTMAQGVGIALTFLGLYLYDRTHDRDKADRKAQLMEIKEEPLLPLDTNSAGGRSSSSSQSPRLFESPLPTSAGFRPNGDDSFKKTDGAGLAAGAAVWLAPGTKQEDTWRAGDRKVGL